MSEYQKSLVHRHGEITGYQMFDPDSDGGSEGRTYAGEGEAWLARQDRHQFRAELGVDLPLEAILSTWIEAFQAGWERALEDQCRAEAAPEW